MYQDDQTAFCGANIGFQFLKMQVKGEKYAQSLNQQVIYVENSVFRSYQYVFIFNIYNKTQVNTLYLCLKLLTTKSSPQ